MRKTLICLLTTMLLICCLLPPMPVWAAETVEPGRACSLTLIYSKGELTFPNCEIEIFRVAEQLGDGSCKPVAPFDQYPVRINGITSQKEWQDTANTLTAYVITDWIPPTHSDKTDSNGRVFFQNLQPGLYLVRGVTAENDQGSCRFESCMIFLPTPRSDGSLDYDLEVKPKGTFTPDPDDPDYPIEPDEQEEVPYKVVKLWKDSGYSAQRPDSVTVEIYKNGILQKTVILNADNNWTYTWNAPVNDDVWMVVERNGAENYTVRITSKGNTFTITNSRQAPAGEPPKTGDSFPLLPLILVMCLSGILLQAMGIFRKRKYQ